MIVSVFGRLAGALTFTAALVLLAPPAATAREAARGAGGATRPGQIIVRFAPSFHECAHCVLAQGASFAAVTGSRRLDALVRTYGVTAARPLFSDFERHGLDPGAAATLQTGAVDRIRTRYPHPGTAGDLPDLTNTFVVEIAPGADPRAAARAFAADRNVVYAEPDVVHTAVLTVTNDPYLLSSGAWGQPFADLWGLWRIGAPGAWDRTRGEGALVAVIDTGADATHPELAPVLWRNPGEIPGNGIDDDRNGYVDDVRGWDFTTCAVFDALGGCAERKTRDNAPDDAHGHGTHVAGTVAAAGGNGIGIVGVAHGARVMVVQGLTRDGVGTVSDLAPAIVYAAANGADVINASWGGTPSAVLRDAVTAATRLGAVFVAAAGNDNADVRDFGPANLDAAIAVAATDHNDRKAWFSNFGSRIDVAAPGGGERFFRTTGSIYSSVLSLLATGSVLERSLSALVLTPAAPGAGRYLRLAGTSMAAPHVSGAAALVRALHPDVTPEQVRQVLAQSADDIEAPGRDLLTGHGRINVASAVALSPPPVARLQSPEPEAELFIAADSPVRGIVDAPTRPLAAWRLTLAPEEDATQAQEVAAGTTTASGILGQVPMELLAPRRRYLLTLAATDTAGVTAYDSVPVSTSEPALLGQTQVTFTIRNTTDPSQNGFMLTATFDGQIPLAVDPASDVFRLTVTDALGPLYTEELPLTDFRIGSGSLRYRDATNAGVERVVISKGAYPYYRVWVGAGRSGVLTPREDTVTVVMHLGSRVALSSPPIACVPSGYRIYCR